VFGSKVRVTRDRGTLLPTDRAEIGAVTIHPSAILRLREDDERGDAFKALVDDLIFVAAKLDGR
jgi:uracil-DNA glycosylase